MEWSWDHSGGGGGEAEPDPEWQGVWSRDGPGPAQGVEQAQTWSGMGGMGPYAGLHPCPPLVILDGQFGSYYNNALLQGISSIKRSRIRQGTENIVLERVAMENSWHGEGFIQTILFLNPFMQHQ